MFRKFGIFRFSETPCKLPVQYISESNNLVSLVTKNVTESPHRRGGWRPPRRARGWIALQSGDELQVPGLRLLKRTADSAPGPARRKNVD